MKKRNIILCSLAAFVGTVVSMSGAFALYQIKNSSADITIGTNTNTDLNLSVSQLAWDNDGKFSPELTKKTLTFKIDAAKQEKSAYTQDTYYGNLKVEIKTTKELADKFASLTDTFKATVGEAELKSIHGEKPGDYYWDKNNTFGFTNDNNGNLSGHINFPVKIGTGATVSIPFEIPKGTTDQDWATLGGDSFKVDITWAENTNADKPYITGSMNGWNKSQDEFLMVPDINGQGNGINWKYTIPSDGNLFTDGAEFKAINENKKDVMIDQSKTNGYSKGNNQKFDSTKVGKTYTWWNADPNEILVIAEA